MKNRPRYACSLKDKALMLKRKKKKNSVVNSQSRINKSLLAIKLSKFTHTHPHTHTHTHIYLYMCLCAKSCLSFCDPTNCSLPGSSVHGIFQARILEWVAFSFSRGSSPPRDQIHIFYLAGRFFNTE